jgi:TPP-dependent pyruvate/acetoin dehydrogenase alpha subunit
MAKKEFDFERAYYLQRTIRRTEEKIAEIYFTDKVKSPVHLSIGQEAIAAGACMALQHEDVVFSNYRGHGHYIAKGGNLNTMWAELYGKANGHAAGKAGSMHLVDVDVNFMPASAIVASAISNAVGYALAQKMRGDDAQLVCFHGEGTTDEGVYWESLNFAALKQVPMLFVCENNGYAIYSQQKDRMAGGSVSERAETFGIEARAADGYSSESVFNAVSTALQDLKNGSGPLLLEVETYRWLDHVGPDDDHKLGYRPQSEMDAAAKKDDIARLTDVIGVAVAEQLDERVETELAEALAFAESGDFPSENALMEHAYA